MIKINQVPCKYTAQFPTEMEFILLHKLLDNKKYRSYFIKNKNNDKYKILDNSAFELGESLDGELLIKWAKKINANEIIIPDSYSNKEKTLQLMDEFLNKYKNKIKKYKLQAVPQGKNQEELDECCLIMLDNPKIDIIGLNKLWNRKEIRVTEKNHILGTNNLLEMGYPNLQSARSIDSRVVSKIITGKEDPWEEKLTKQQLIILQNLIDEVNKNEL